MTPGSDNTQTALAQAGAGPRAAKVQGIGAPRSRLDGAQKVTGAATYAAEFKLPALVYGTLVPAAIANGRVSRIDTEAAAAAPGVLKVFTYQNMPRLNAAPVPPAAQSYTPMQDDRVLYEGQPVALVVAETLEQAQHGATLVAIGYEQSPATLFGRGEELKPEKLGGYAFLEPDVTVGDIEAGLKEAEVTVEQNYSLPSRHHNPMEPSATIAHWQGDQLTMYDATQWTYGVRYALSALLGIEPANIRVRCPFTGGGFGCKGYVWPHQILTAVAAREIRRPLKVASTRADMYTGAGYQPAMRQTVTLGAKKDGRLTAVRHKTLSVSSAFDDYIEYGNAGTRALYSAPNLQVISRFERANLGTPTAMRAPHEGPGMFALESAMDELAYALDIDPLALRLKNYAERDPLDGREFSSKELRACYRQGAERFGWDQRPMQPRSLKEGKQLIGMGVASAIMTTFRFPAAARIRLRADGRVVVQAGTQEIGTGTYTVFPQIAAEALGIDPDQIVMELGDTSLPETGGTFGSSSTMCVGSAVKVAADKLRARLVDLARHQQESPLAGADAADVVAQQGRLVLNSDPTRAVGYTEILKHAGAEEVSAEGDWTPGAPFDIAGHQSGRSMHTFGAVFAEVAVDPDLGLVRLRRCVAGYSAGRIINPRTARSQMIGGIVWGYGQALLEQSPVEPRFGRYLSKNLSGVMLPVNADIPEIDVFFVEEHDPHASLIGARGIGELGAVGVSAAIANAVFHATGKRVRDLPITIEALADS